VRLLILNSVARSWIRNLDPLRLRINHSSLLSSFIFAEVYRQYLRITQNKLSAKAQADAGASAELNRYVPVQGNPITSACPNRPYLLRVVFSDTFVVCGRTPNSLGLPNHLDPLITVFVMQVPDPARAGVDSAALLLGTDLGPRHRRRQMAGTQSRFPSLRCLQSALTLSD
jgi:hypothetical protein